MSHNENRKDEIIEFLLAIYNDLYMESGKIQGTVPNLQNIKSILDRKLPTGLVKSKAGLISISTE